MNTTSTKNINISFILMGISPILLLTLFIGLFSGYQLAEMYVLKQIWPIAVVSTIIAASSFFVLPKIDDYQGT